MNEFRMRLEDLLVAQATEGLTSEEGLEVTRLQESFPDVEGFELAAAAIQLAMESEYSEMPEGLQSAVEAEARRYLRPVDSVRDSRSPAPRRTSWRMAVTAAAIVLAFVGGRWLLPGTSDVGDSVVPGPGTTELVAQRTNLMAKASDLMSLDWTATDDPAAARATGDVVWSHTQQEGYMRFRGLAANDVSAQQYQLWVFDTARDDRYPVDGGVFDIPAGVDEVIVPIDPKVFVNEAVLFAVTVERPGGVVVSDRERIVVLAKPTEG